MVTLTGITWDHSRGFVPLAATAQRFEEINKNVRIHWQKRSLAEFGEFPVDKLAAEYDLAIIDHPWAGYAVEKKCFINLAEAIEHNQYNELYRDAIGLSAESYLYEGNQVAMAIDAAAPIALYSPGKMSSKEIPSSWTDVLNAAKEKRAISAGNPTSLLMEFYMFCNRLNPDIFKDDLIDTDSMSEALEIIAEYFSWLDPICYQMNPIAIHEILSRNDNKYCYTPCEFGYSNYSRTGYAQTKLKATNLVTYKNMRLRTILGGAGIAISRKCQHPEIALSYLMYSISPRIQTSIYGANGGQPSSKQAWEDTELNALCNNFFLDTQQTLEESILRPRFSGYIGFQDNASIIIQKAIKGEIPIRNAVKKIKENYSCIVDRRKK